MPPVAPVLPKAAHETELAELRETLKGLRLQLAETMERIDQLEEED
jgi:phage shock protein A